MEKLAFSLKGKRREREFSSPAAKEFIKQAAEKFGADFEVRLNPETIVTDDQPRENRLDES